MMKRWRRYPREELARRGESLYEHQLRPIVEAGNDGKFILIDIETGAYEVDIDEDIASDRLYARVPTAQPWMRRIGLWPTRRFGCHIAPENPK